MNNTKKSIFDAAINIFSSKGYNGATMDDIATFAGVAKGTLYYHFKSKEEIFNFIISEGMNLIKVNIIEATLNETDPLEKLKALSKVQLSFVYNNKNFFKVVMSQLWGQELRQLELRNALHEYIILISIYIEEAIKKGVIEDTDPNLLAYTFFGILTSAAIYELLNEVTYDLDKLIDKLMRYMLNGIGIVQT